jgi:hypothetical protein
MAIFVGGCQTEYLVKGNAATTLSQFPTATRIAVPAERVPDGRPAYVIASHLSLVGAPVNGEVRARAKNHLYNNGIATLLGGAVFAIVGTGTLGAFYSPDRPCVAEASCLGYAATGIGFLASGGLGMITGGILMGVGARNPTQEISGSKIYYDARTNQLRF